MRSFRRPLLKLPTDTQVSLFLIKEELKSRKLFHVLHDVGLDDCYFQPHLDSLILQSVGICDHTDEIFNEYTEILDKRSRKIKMDHESIVKQALKVYIELQQIKKQLNIKNE